MSAIKTAVAGAARSLWMEHIGPSLSHENFLKHEFGARIVWNQARLVLGSPISLQGFAMLTMARWSIANAAQYLATNCGIEQEWFLSATPGKIIGAYEGRLQLELDNRVSIADAAQWLYHNRGCRLQTLAYKPSSVILQMYELCKLADRKAALVESEKKYSLSDLRKAYDMGFGASGQGWNQEIHPDYLGKEDYQAERHEALREFK